MSSYLRNIHNHVHKLPYFLFYRIQRLQSQTMQTWGYLL